MMLQLDRPQFIRLKIMKSKIISRLWFFCLYPSAHFEQIRTLLAVMDTAYTAHTIKI